MRIMLAGTKSGAGKTTIVCGLIELFKRRSLSVSAFKSGPDYIDPMFHRAVLGIPTGNLDGFLSDKKYIANQTAEAEKNSDILVIEGAMGHFDGIGFSDKASCAETAEITDTPVILVVDAAACGYSAMAVVNGFINMPKGENIKGVIFNRMSSVLYKSAAEEVKRLGLIPCGYIPTDKNLSLESRHLGLITPNELENINSKIKYIADTLEKTLDLDSIIKIAMSAPKKDIENDENYKKYDGLRIGLTSDCAFSFVYDDLIRAFEKRRVEVIKFSPVNDKGLPENLSGLYICGGYPEIYAEELSENTNMLEAVRNAFNNKMPIIAECGGYMYMSEGIADINGKVWKTVGAVKGVCSRQKRLVHFGYGRLKLKNDCLIGKKGEEFPVHSFHYYETDCVGNGFKVTKVSNGDTWEEGTLTDSFYGGFPHFYMQSNDKMLETFLDKCSAWRKNNE